jgi:hypothetical protein
MTTWLGGNSKILNAGIILNRRGFSTSFRYNSSNNPRVAKESNNSNDSKESNSLLNNLKDKRKYLSIIKKLPKYILMGVIFKLIIFLIITTLSFFNINPKPFYLLI